MTRRERFRLYAQEHFTAVDDDGAGLVLPSRRGAGRQARLARLARLSRLAERAAHHRG
ncbi:hypothetical protein J5Y04_40395 [Kitasatospora sp. RG8]|uniref:hypothetical protein n=1 Tax=Kitasatospora sp. RG8 TaxID=2820815 RepID=UPI001AE0BF2D|nr:hypothetical protein [Kitasatospora sp. RG8]MBP0455740.1 hypothetical protein [Kitasatospora sp. RG8]